MSTRIQNVFLHYKYCIHTEHDRLVCALMRTLYVAILIAIWSGTFHRLLTLNQNIIKTEKKPEYKKYKKMHKVHYSKYTIENKDEENLRNVLYVRWCLELYYIATEMTRHSNNWPISQFQTTIDYRSSVIRLSGQRSH